jgi:hypothetical protein
VGQTNADPGRVFASGSGLIQGETGKKNRKLFLKKNFH